MLYRITDEPLTWNGVSIAAATLVAGEIALAWTVVARGIRLDGAAVALGAVVTIGSVLVLARCRLPLPIKGALLLGLVASVLGCMAVQDALGAKRVRADADAALGDAAAHGADHVRVNAAPGAGSGGDRVAQALEGALARQAGGGGVSVTLAPVDVNYDPDHPYRLHWTLERGGDRLWCGDYTVEDRRRPDVSLLADRVADALAASRNAGLACQ